MAHLLPALFTIRKGKQSSVLVFLGRLLEVFRDRGGKNPTKPNQNKNLYTLPHRQGISGELPNSWVFSLPPLMRVGGQISVGCSGRHMHKHTRTCCPSGAFCQMSSFLSRVVSGRSSSRSAGPCPGESPIAIPSLAARPGWLHSLQPSSKAPQ